MKIIEICTVFCVFLSLLHNALGSDDSSMNSSKEQSEMLETGLYVLKELYKAFVEDLTNYVGKITACVEGKPRGSRENPRFGLASLRIIEECIRGTGLDMTLQGLVKLFPETISSFLPQMSNVLFKLAKIPYLKNMMNAVGHHDLSSLFNVVKSGQPPWGVSGSTCNGGTCNANHGHMQ